MVRDIKLTKGYVALIDDQDFERVSALKWHVIPADSRHPERNAFYAIHTTSDGGKVRLHRFILGVTDDRMVDHRNGNGLDCRRANLRVATRSQNGANAKGRSRRLPFKGIEQNDRTGRWRARTRKNGIRIYSSYFATPEQAAAAYDQLARVHHGLFAATNFPLDGERAA